MRGGRRCVAIETAESAAAEAEADRRRAIKAAEDAAADRRQAEHDSIRRARLEAIANQVRNESTAAPTSRPRLSDEGVARAVLAILELRARTRTGGPG